MKRIVVSGAGGFLGKNILKKAIEEKIPVIAITKKRDVFADQAVTIIRTEEFLNQEIKLNQNDVFINCLFPTNADGIQLANGLNTAYQMIKTAKAAGVGSFINISSQSVYPSRRDFPAKETDPLSLETPYAVGKYSTEEYTSIVFADQTFCNIRLASLIGIGYEQRIINRMADQALQGETMKVAGGMQRYGFLDVRDAASALVCLSQSDASLWEKTYNLGRNDYCTLLDITETIVSILKTYGKEACFEVTEGFDNRNSSLDASKFMNTFGWRPAVSIRQMIEDIIENKAQEV